MCAVLYCSRSCAHQHVCLVVHGGSACRLDGDCVWYVSALRCVRVVVALPIFSDRASFCVDVNECSSAPCANGGSFTNAFTCTCPAGYRCAVRSMLAYWRVWCSRCMRVCAAALCVRAS